MQQLVIIDRDGVINERVPQGLLAPEQLRPVPGSLEAIARLNHAGLRVAVSARRAETPEGLLSITSMNRIHARLQQLLARRGGHIDAFFIDADPEDKDGPDQETGSQGTIEIICDRFSTTPEQSVIVLNNPRNAEAAAATGAIPYVVSSGMHKGSDIVVGPNHFEDLMSATDVLLRS